MKVSIELQYALLQAYLKGNDVYGAIPTGEVRYEGEKAIDNDEYDHDVYRATVFAVEHSNEITSNVSGDIVTAGIGIHVYDDIITFYSSGWSHEVTRKDIPEFNTNNK